MDRHDRRTAFAVLALQPRRQPNAFRLDEALKSQGAHVITADAYDKAEIEARVEEGLKLAAEGLFTILIIRGTCIRKVPASAYGQKLAVDKELCRDRKSTRLNSSHLARSRMPSSA